MPEHLRPAFERLVAAIPAPWLVAPISGEVFDSKDMCRKRLQAYALTQGFAVVVRKSDKDRIILHCVHHGIETRNDRGLEPWVERDAEGKIVSQRQRDTYCKKKDCLWLYYCSFKAISKETDTREWVLTVK
jgi:hypothetical protein